MQLNNLLNTNLTTPITGLALDSRLVKPGDLFFACPGSQMDGRKFIQDAITKGAAAVLQEDAEEALSYQNKIPIISVINLKNKISEISSRFYNCPSKKLKMIGITGTNGKTSCSHFIAAALQSQHVPCGIIGTLGSGLSGAVKPGNLTTPDAITLQKTFAEFVTLGAKAVAMEVSSHSLDQGRVNDIDFAVGVFTNLTRDHLDYHGTMEAYGAAKRKLFDNPLLQDAVINVDDPFGQHLITTLPRKNIFSYSITKTADIYADNIQLSFEGIRAEIMTPWGRGNIAVSLIGGFNLSNVLATIATLCLLQVPFSDVLAGVAKLSCVPGRMQMLGGGNLPLVVVDYSHTPDALEKVLTALRAHTKGKLLCVFGCGGDRDRGKRPLMAQIAERLADRVIVTDDNPRTEAPQVIVADMMSGFVKPNEIIVQHDRSLAIKEAIQYAGAEDCVLIAGKGAETYQLIGEKKLPFSDVEKVKEALLNYNS